MQFINNIEPGLRKKILIAGIIFAIFLVLLTMLVTNNKTNDGSQSSSNEYYDPASGETVSDPEGKSPETFGASPEQEVYLGFSKLLDVGVTKFQVDASKIAFGIFSNSRSEKISEVSVYVDTVKRMPFNTEDPTRQVKFDVIVNRKDRYQATLEYSSIKSARLILNQSGKEVFRSEDINPIGYDEDHAEEGDLYIPPEDR